MSHFGRNDRWWLVCAMSSICPERMPGEKTWCYFGEKDAFRGNIGKGFNGSLQVSYADNFRKQFGPRMRPDKMSPLIWTQTV